jgi:RNA polymerase sigma-70 factor, ECF subfamily
MVHAPSFANLYATQFGFVWSMTRHLGVNIEELDDIVQDVFLIIHDRLHTLERPEALRSWIFGIVRRVVSGHHRAKRADLNKRGTLQVVSEVFDSKPSTPQELLERSEQASLLWRLLEEIGPAKRQVFVLAEIREMTAPEIAEITSIPLSTVYARLRFARQELEEALQRYRARSLAARWMSQGSVGQVLPRRALTKTARRDASRDGRSGCE